MTRMLMATVALASLAACTAASTSAGTSASQAAPTSAGATATATSAAAPAATTTAAPTAATSASAAADVLTPDGYGPVRIGMTTAEVQRILGPGWTLEDPLEPGDANGCRHLVQAGDATHGPLAYMMNEGVLTRISYDADGSTAPGTIRTDRGLTLGASEAEVRAVYGSAVQAETHNYTGEPAKYLTIWTRAPRTPESEDRQARGIRYTTNEHRRVDSIIVGDSSIQYIEGCA